MKLKVPQAIILALTELTSTTALMRQLQKKPPLYPATKITQIPKDRLWETLSYDDCRGFTTPHTLIQCLLLLLSSVKIYLACKSQWEFMSLTLFRWNIKASSTLQGFPLWISHPCWLFLFPWIIGKQDFRMILYQWLF